MWGQILIESSIQQNFNFGFSTHKSDILLHLSQWQYWWWFWFSLLWVAYYYIIIYCVTKRVFLFNPVINTSIRGHGKWGDFLVALIPLSWCGNILVNSNFILRMIEWQNESSLFTLRVQGKQWYWVYKFDGNSTTSILSAPKNIGHNKWLSWFSNDVFISDSYYQAIHLASQLEFQDTYKSLLDKNMALKNTLELNNLISNKIFNITLKNKNILDNWNFMNTIPTIKNFINLPLSENKTILINKLNAKYIKYLSKVNFLTFGEVNYNYFFKKLNNNIFMHYDFNRLDDISDTMGNLRIENNIQPLRILKSPINLYLIDSISNKAENILFSVKFNNNVDNISLKNYQTETLTGFRQKKYKRLKKFIFTPTYSYNPDTYSIEKTNNINMYSSQRNLQDKQFISLSNKNYDNYQNISIFYKDSQKKNIFPNKTTEFYKNNFINKSSEIINLTNFDFYKAIKNSKQRNDLLSVTLARRLLRVKRTLVLPAHVNITVITNSYDVVHSWFIPGLGIKLDCVPGRSTHHTFYIDNIGFYYGQCAEICGRYHHHMPIRICALSFDQFLVWWHKKGLPHMNRLQNQGKLNSNLYKNILHSTNYKNTPIKYTSYKYNW